MFWWRWTGALVSYQGSTCRKASVAELMARGTTQTYDARSMGCSPSSQCTELAMVDRKRPSMAEGLHSP